MGNGVFAIDSNLTLSVLCYVKLLFIVNLPFLSHLNWLLPVVWNAFKKFAKWTILPLRSWLKLVYRLCTFVTKV